MTKKLTLLMAQINPLVGAIEQNAKKIIAIITQHQDQHDLIIFPELALTGYPPEDLLLRPSFHQKVAKALADIAETIENCHVIIGHPHLEGAIRFNSASLFFQGKQIALYHKQKLPNYAVFDEDRYFTPGNQPCIFNINGYRLGLCICEDIWNDEPIAVLKDAGAEMVICINASPFDYKKYHLREQLLQHHAQKGLTIAYVNQVGGQDELVFDGQSLVMAESGEVRARARSFTEQLSTVVLNGGDISGEITPLPSQDELIYQALVCGLQDYVNKNRFPGVLLGLSGGIDSALTLAVAVDALGAERVHAVMMPSRYTADISVVDAEQQLTTLMVSSSLLSIEPLFKSFLTTLAPEFEGLKPDTTEENLQARIRGVLLMALSNKSGKMVLTTSNKSETSVGYATLYGDMAGGFSVLKDVLKTQVYQLARYRNSVSPVIPERVITRAPSAELAENQKDQDSLPEYAVLDAIIVDYMEKNVSAEDIIAKGYNSSDVTRVIQLIKRNEYKRRQAAPGVKVSPRAFGRDWRLPITSGFEE